MAWRGVVGQLLDEAFVAHLQRNTDHCVL